MCSFRATVLSKLQTWWASSHKSSTVMDVYKLFGEDGPGEYRGSYFSCEGAVGVHGALPRRSTSEPAESL